MSTQALGKRGSGEVFEEPTSRKSHLSYSSSMSQTTLQRRILELETSHRNKVEELESLREENIKLRGDRKVFLEGENHERTTGEAREKEWSEERLRLNGQIRDLRSSNSRVSEELAQLQSKYRQLDNKHSAESLNSSSSITFLEGRVKELEAEVKESSNWKRRATALSIDLAEERRRTQEGMQRGQDDRENQQVDQVVRMELTRQSTYLTGLKQTSAALQTEVQDLRKRMKEADGNARAHRDVERSLRDEVRTLQEQLERARRDMDSLTQNFSSDTSGSSSSTDLATVQSRLQALSELHSKATTDLAAKDTDIRSLHSRLSALSESSATNIKEWTGRAKEAERELRWAREGRESAERREEFARKQIEALRSGEGEAGGGVTSVDSSSRVRQLEKLVETYKAELDSMSRDSRDLEDRLTEGKGLVKQSLLDESQAKIGQLESDIASLESTISALTSANTTLDAEVNDLMRRVASGEYNPATERCLELKVNPASKIQSIRAKQLEDLKQENEALLDRLRQSASATSPAEGSGSVPVESWERLKRENQELEKAHAKRLQRLKEIFGNKSKEFLEAVYSLLGWRIKFDESGTDIRLTSMYAPKGKMGLTLKFASQEGHFGTMQMTGAMARGLEETRHFWIVERQSVPGFLAQITTEMFEKTTIGRAAGYVGLE